MCSCTTSVPSVCRSLSSFHSYYILFAGFLLLAGFTHPACSQEESTRGLTGFASESTSTQPAMALEGSLSKSTEGGRFELLGSMGGKVGPVALQEAYAYVGIGRTLTVLDVSDPASPGCVKRISRPTTISAITTTEDLVIVGDESGEVCVYDLVDPATPVWLNREHPLLLGGDVTIAAFFVRGSSLYAFWGGTLFVVDLADPTFPKLTGTCEISDVSANLKVSCQDICVKGDYAFLVSRDTGSLVVVDIRQRANPVVVTTEDFGTDTPLYSLLVQGEVLYALGESLTHLRLYCIDVSEPPLPHVLGSVGLESFSSGVRDFAIKGNRIYITGSSHELVDVLDPADPLRYVLKKMYPNYLGGGRSAFDGKTLLVARRSHDDIVCIDWTRAGNPTEKGSYQEPPGFSNLALQGNTLFVGSYMWLVDVPQPGDLKVLSRVTPGFNPRPVGEDLMVAEYGNEQSCLYDISDPSSPILLSTFYVRLIGDVVYEEPYLYGVSTDTGLTVVDLRNPAMPVVLFRASPAGTGYWTIGVFKTGNFIYTHRNSSSDGLFIYDVTQPTQPVLVSSMITNLYCDAMKGVGRSLYLPGANIFTSSPMICGYDLSDPIHPQEIPQIPIKTYPTALEISSGLAYVTTEGPPRFQVFDITSPGSPLELTTSGESLGAGNINDILASGSRLFVTERSGLSIYRHILPATPTEVTFNCAGLIQQDTRELHFKVFAGEPLESGCNTVSVISGTPLVDCRIGCPFITSEGTVSCDETPFNLSPTVDCDQTLSLWLNTVAAAIDDQAGDMLRVTRTGQNSFLLESIQTFCGALCGPELGLSCEGQSNRVLYDCSISNLMDGVDGNENAAETGGFGIVWVKDSETEEATPTPTDTSIIIPTFTETITDTPTPTSTRTPYPTATRTDIYVDSSETELEKVSVLGGGIGAVAIDGRYAYVAYGLHLTVLDIEDPENPKFIKQIFQKYSICTAIVSDWLLVVADEKGYLNIYSLDNPADPVLLNKDRTFGLGGTTNTITSFFLQGNTLYVTRALDALVVVDLSNPSTPQRTGDYFNNRDSDGNCIGADDVWINGDTAFLASRTGQLKVLSLSSQSDPTWIGDVTGFSSAPCGVTGSGTRLYVIDGINLYCFDATNPQETQLLGTTGCTGRYIEMAGEGKVVTWNPTSSTQVFDVSDSVHPNELEVSSLPDKAGLFAHKGTVACISSGQQVQFFNWSDPSQPSALGSYSEDLLGSISGVSTKDSVLFAWGAASSSSVYNLCIIDIANPLTPRNLSKIEGLAYVNSVVLTDDSYLLISTISKLLLYNLTDRSHPELISSMSSVKLTGDVASFGKSLFGVSSLSGVGFQVVDFSDPFSPFVAGQSNPYQETKWNNSVAGKAGFAFATINSPKNELLVYNVTDPATPDLVFALQYGLPYFTPKEIELKGDTLYFEGVNYNYKKYLLAFDISDPSDPRLKKTFLFPEYGNEFIVSAGMAYTCGGTTNGLMVTDISDPEEPRLLNKTSAPDAIGVVTNGPYVITAEGSSGIAVYHQTFDKPATEVTFSCAGSIHPDSRELHFKIYADEPSENGCGSSTYISAEPLVDCRLGCTSLTSGGTISCVTQTTDCNQVISTWIDTVVAAIDDQAGDMLRVIRTGQNSFSLESIQPFYGAVYGDELGLPGQENRILYDCPIHNLMDGVDGNEGAVAAGGFGIVWVKDGVAEEPTATPTPSSTKTLAPTPTFTVTALPTDTSTPTPTPTETVDGNRFERVASFGGETRVVALAGEYAYAGIGPHLTVLDITDPADPKCIKRIRQTYLITAISMSGNLLVTGDEMGSIFTFNIENPADPILLNSSNSLTVGSGTNPIKKILLQGTKAYITSETVTLTVVDLSDPNQPESVGTYQEYQTNGVDPAAGLDVCLVGDTAYLGVEGSTLHILNLNDEADPTLHKILPTVAGPSAMAVSGEYVYALGNEILYCLNAAVPRSPGLLSMNDINANYLALNRNNLFAWGPSFGLYNVSNPHNPVKLAFDPLPHSGYDPLDPLHPYPISVSHLVASGTITLIARSNGDFLLVDWQDLSHPQVMGTYSEPVRVSCLNMNDSNLFVSGYANWGYIWNVDLSDINNPKVISDIQSLKGFYSVSLASDDSFLIAGYAERPMTIYDISDLKSPKYLSSLNINISGKMAYDWPYLYIASSKNNLTVIDLIDPVNPVMVHDGNVGDPCSLVNAEKKGDYVYSFVNQNLLVFDVGKPVSPSLIYSMSTEINIGKPNSSYLAGHCLFLCGYEYQYPRRPYLYSFDLTDPSQPEPDLSILLFQDPMRFAVSAGAAYLCKTSTLAAMDITPPDVGDVLCASGDKNANGCITYGPYVIANDGSYGLSIYRHILPATPTEVTFNCAGLIHQDTRELHFKIFAGEPPESGCNTASVISATPLVDCRIGCPYITGEGTVSCDETPFNLPQTVDCEQTVNTWIDTVVAAIDDQAGDMLRVTRTGQNSFSLESIQPFYGALCGQELGLACVSQENRVLNDCPISNLMDGVDGNENAVEAGGFGIVWAKHTETEEATPTPTATLTDTPQPTGTPMGTATETPIPTDTETPGPSPTATLDVDVVPDGVINAKDLLGLIGAMETKPSGNWTELLFDFSQAWKP